MTGIRVVSLVPSVTETLLDLGVVPVGCTRFCEQPALPAFGGTKDPDVAAIVSLAPDVVVVNDEENRAEDADALRAAGIRLHVTGPRSVEDVGATVVDLAAAVGVEPPEPFATRWRDWCASMLQLRWYDAFVAVWRRPWMALGPDTYGASLLDLLGVVTVFSEATSERYPEVTLHEAATRAPNLVLLPSEPYPFGARHLAEVEAALPGVPVVLVDGRDLFWWGTRTPAAAERLRDALPA